MGCPRILENSCASAIPGVLKYVKEANLGCNIYMQAMKMMGIVLAYLLHVKAAWIRLVWTVF